MRQTFKTWREANKHAQAQANTSGVLQGIEYLSYNHVWLVRPLPGKDRRYGMLIAVPVGFMRKLCTH